VYFINKFSTWGATNLTEVNKARRELGSLDLPDDHDVKEPRKSAIKKFSYEPEEDIAMSFDVPEDFFEKERD